jgi:nitroreductase
MLLAVTDLGLGAVWTGVYPEQHLIPEVKKLFKLPEGVEPHALVFIGYPDVEARRKDRFKPERIHKDKW